MATLNGKFSVTERCPSSFQSVGLVRLVHDIRLKQQSSGYRGSTFSTWEKPGAYRID